MLYIMIFTLLSVQLIVASSPPDNHLNLVIINSSTLTLTYENSQTSPSTSVDISADVINPRSNVTMIAYVDLSQHEDVVVLVNFKCDNERVSLFIDDRVHAHMVQAVFQILHNELAVSNILSMVRVICQCDNGHQR